MSDQPEKYRGPKEGALELRPEQPLAQIAPSPGMLLKGIIDKGVTGENVAAVEKLIELYERMEDRDAEKAFAAAFNALQAEMPRVVAKKPVYTKDQTLKYKFAPYEEIMEQVRPLLLKHGFTVSFDQDYQQDRSVVTCLLTHKAGHKKSFKFGAKIGTGPPGASAAQADGAAGTYAKRFALCNALNIIVEVDDDARGDDVGNTVTPEQAKSLRERVKATGSDEAMFLKFAGCKTYEEIPTAKYAMLDANLKKKEKTT